MTKHRSKNALSKTAKKDSIPLKRSKNVTKDKVNAKSNINQNIKFINKLNLRTYKQNSKLAKSNIHETTNVWQLSLTTLKVIWSYKWHFIGLLLVYIILNVILVQGLINSTTMSSFELSINQLVHGNLSGLGIGAASLIVLAGTTVSGVTTSGGGSYQPTLEIILSLSIIWSLYQIKLDNKLISVKKSLYDGMCPFIPFVLILLLIGVEALPMVIGAAIYSIVMANGIAVVFYERMIWLAVFILLSLVSLYFISSSSIALFIVTQPNMTPILALRRAKKLVKYRRPEILLKIAYLIIILFILTIILLLPFALYAQTYTSIVYYIVSVVVLLMANAFMFTLSQDLQSE